MIVKPMDASEPLPTRASLLERLKETSDDASWQEFHRTYRGLLVGVARRAGLNEHETEEALQDTLIAVAKKMPGFRYEPGKDSFKGWLLQIVRWKIVDQVRRRPPTANPTPSEEQSSVAAALSWREEAELDSVILIPGSVPDPQEDFNVIWDTEWERHLLTQALARAKRLAKPQDYSIYHLHVIEERSVAEVRQALAVSTASIYLAKHRVGKLVKRELQKLRAAGV
jgi:RNA polymerase sigma-70 factor (ECF subfamily)